MRSLRWSLFGLAALLLAACASTPTVEDVAMDEQYDSADQTTGFDTRLGGDYESFGEQNYGSEGAGGAGGAGQDTVASLEAGIVYFDYDSSVVAPEYLDLIRRNAAYLVNNPGAQLTVEGHTDERGSREYNLALGQRRAETVKQLLLARGASSAQVRTVSYGEEKPQTYGSGESDWARNRRVVFDY